MLPSLTPVQSLGIPVALASTLFVAVGAQLQQRGVAQLAPATDRPAAPLGLAQLGRLMRRPLWALGTMLLGIAVLLQLYSLYLAPLPVVQPLGAVGLVLTVIMTARLSRSRVGARTVWAMAASVLGVAAFVTIAATGTRTAPVADGQLEVLLALLAGVMALIGVGFALPGVRARRGFHIAGAGVVFGFVATLTKSVIVRVQLIAAGGFQLHQGDVLALVCIGAIIAASVLGNYLVNQAYSSGTPDAVVAALTVIDPIVGVALSITVLGELQGASPWAVALLVASAALAVFGVVWLGGQGARGERDAAASRPAAAAAEAVGYQSEYAFSRAFSRVHGVPPQRYRRGFRSGRG